MKKHLGWAVRMLIAAAGVGYILYTLNWSDQVWLPAGYEVQPGIHGGEDGRRYSVIKDHGKSYTIGVPPDSQGTGPDWGEIAKADLVTSGQGPRFEPSFLTLIGQANGPLLAGGLLVFAPVFLIGSLRWLALMRARGIEIGFGRVYRLTMAGAFFNLCMPGTTGGDVMKAYYAAKGTHQRADAVVSVAVDRACGLIGLILLAGVVGLFSLEDPLLRKITTVMWVGLFSVVFIAWLYTSPTVRARLRLGGLIGKVPGAALLRKLDALVAAYRNHVGALLSGIGLSLPIHLSLAFSMVLAGYALGLDQPMLYLLGIVPVVLMLWSLPVSGPLGLGPLDYVAVQLVIGASDNSAQQAVMMFVAYRLYAVVIGLCGSLALLGSDAPSASEAKAVSSGGAGDANETSLP